MCRKSYLDERNEAEVPYATEAKYPLPFKVGGRFCEENFIDHLDTWYVNLVHHKKVKTFLLL